MKDDVYHQYASTLDDKHWWVAHRRAIFTEWLNSLNLQPDGMRPVLELGSGVGGEHSFLSAYGPVTGVEISSVGASYCEKRGYAELLTQDLNDCDFGRERFDFAVDFHVLYHQWVKDPAPVLARVFAALRPGGYLLMTEPAFEALRRSHDDVVMAARRWNKADLRGLVQDAGFEVERSTGFLSPVAPIALASAWLDRFRPPAADIKELHSSSPITETLFRTVLGFERAILKLGPIPFGTCWAILARKPRGLPKRGLGTALEGPDLLTDIAPSCDHRDGSYLTWNERPVQFVDCQPKNRRIDHQSDELNRDVPRAGVAMCLATSERVGTLQRVVRSDTSGIGKGCSDPHLHWTKHPAEPEQAQVEDFCSEPSHTETKELSQPHRKRLVLEFCLQRLGGHG